MVFAFGLSSTPFFNKMITSTRNESTMKKRRPYPPTALLPGVSYPDPNDALFDDPVLDLEYTTLRHLENLAGSIKTSLIEEGKRQVPEFLVAHLCAYLGYLSVYTLGLKRATALEKPLTALIQHQAQEAFSLFDQYPVNSGETRQKHEHLEQCRSQAPGSIIVQTIRLGRYLFDMIDELDIQCSFQSGHPSKQTEIFCSVDRLMMIFKQHADDLGKESRLAERDKRLAINQTAIQIGYLIGYYGHFDGTPQRYYEYGLPCIPLFMEYGDKFIQKGL